MQCQNSLHLINKFTVTNHAHITYQTQPSFFMTLFLLGPKYQANQQPAEAQLK